MGRDNDSRGDSKMIEIDEWKPSGPISVQCPYCMAENATYLPSEDDIRCQSCYLHEIQEYGSTPIVVTVTVKV